MPERIDTNMIFSVLTDICKPNRKFGDNGYFHYSMGYYTCLKDVYDKFREIFGEIFDNGIVTKNEYDMLEKRFNHLMESEFIAGFDEIDHKTGEYKKDISEANFPAIKCKDCINRCVIDDDYTADGIYLCEYNRVTVGLNDYCSRGKMKGDNPND